MCFFLEENGYFGDNVIDVIGFRWLFFRYGVRVDVDIKINRV